MVSVRILFKQNTVLKQRPLQSSQLANFELQKIPVGTILVLQSYSVPANNADHYKIGLSKIQFPIGSGSSSNWYVYAPHVQILDQPPIPVATIKQLVDQQQAKNVVRISADKQIIGNQQGFLKLVVNRDTVIKRDAVSSDILAPGAKQDIPAGTELILATNPPNANNFVEFPLDRSHVKFNLKDVALKGFYNWFVFIEHVGIGLV